MKRKVVILIVATLLPLAVAPIINTKLETYQRMDGYKWWSKAALFNLDFVIAYLNRHLYYLGISTSPEQVVIGKDDWLFLGDKYAETISTKRRGATQEDLLIAKKISVSSKLQEQWLKHHGVKIYQVMIGPDKDSIYSEFLPDWVTPSPNTKTNILLTNVDHNLYADTRSVLIEAKSKFSENLYYKTDTHWNNFGAWVAFSEFSKILVALDSELRRLTDKQIHVRDVKERTGGDLAKFLMLTSRLRDREPVIEIDTEHPIDVEQYDFETGQLKTSGGNPRIETQHSPLLVKSKYALNQKRVLWLRDSFGTAISPFMSATFSDVLQLHYDDVNPSVFEKLVTSFKPDYVFVTVVERQALKSWFENTPPT